MGKKGPPMSCLFLLILLRESSSPPPKKNMEKTPRIAVSSTHRASKRGQRSPKCCQASMVLSRKAAALVGRQCVHNSDWILLHSCTLTVIVVYYTVSLGQSDQFTTCVCVCFFGFLNRLALCIFFFYKVSQFSCYSLFCFAWVFASKVQVQVRYDNLFERFTIRGNKRYCLTKTNGGKQFSGSKVSLASLCAVLSKHPN